MLLGGGAMAYLTRLTVTSSYAGGVLPALLVMGLGFGMIIAPGHQHRHRRRPARGLRRRLGAGQHRCSRSAARSAPSALSTIALTRDGQLPGRAPHRPAGRRPIAATHGYTLAFAVSAALFGLGVILAIVLLPSKLRLAQLREAAIAASEASEAPAAPSGAASGAADTVSSTA